jgi:plasmid stabilization system protein ParE
VTRRPVIRQRARADIRQARGWYEQQRAGLGGDFVTAVDATVAGIVAMPQRFPEVSPGFRRALVDRFPYKVVFRELGQRIIIVAVYHNSRDPARVQERIDEENQRGG